MTKQQAKKGGQYGINGSFYKGGQFLPSSENTDKGAQNGKKRKKSKKEEISTYCWRVPPADNLRSIYTIIIYVCKWDSPPTYTKEHGNVGTLKLLEDIIVTMHDTGDWRGDVEESLAKHRKMVEGFNKGLRWMDSDTWEPVEVE